MAGILPDLFIHLSGGSLIQAKGYNTFTILCTVIALVSGLIIFAYPRLTVLLVLILSRRMGICSSSFCPVV